MLAEAPIKEFRLVKIELLSGFEHHVKKLCEESMRLMLKNISSKERSYRVN